MSTVSEGGESPPMHVPRAASAQETIEALLRRSRRQALPLRRSFVQQGTARSPEPGPLADFVRRRDDRALELYLLFRAVASAAPWNVDESALLWARSLDLGTSRSAVSSVSKIWKRLEDRRLVARKRSGGRTSIIALREDGSGEPYVHPSTVGRREPYFKLPFAYWTAEDAWYRKLGLAETAVLLIALSLADGFILPYEMARRWYGISAETAERGLHGLQERNLLQVRRGFKPAPLAPRGYTEQRYYTLCSPFGPQGHRSASAARAAGVGQ